ncbi:acetate kinase [Helicobacter hepaticus]|jgi:acetate kinase|uniref:Acetate kinase n=2 Tax=Helicobacter TaxID=209 RepID=ACKA_HELHP|nr:acetate kinase [Helicobacter hepaticus]Q7VGL3.1 RecName: Full=Acetate kinase; AltName: Full=Acetokinase [Helicobacter hepaticus ATCC 51449]AAP77905.1 acetate kinase [Helicobacter hepaticus ATCC 51449]
MNILVINCGSSSLKFQLIDTDTEKVLANGICDRIGIEGSVLQYKNKEGKKSEKKEAMPNHTKAIEMVLEALTNKQNGAISSLDDIRAIGHRVVHGGEFFKESVLINDTVIAHIKECSDLAPLHNPANLMGIDVCKQKMPNTPMVAVFDTAFHQSMPPQAYTYGVPYEWYEKHKVRRYGFHGTSHKYVSQRTTEFLGLDYHNSKIIVCHLGNGSSISAIKNGKCVDTSMGLTPLEGLIMGTRCGDLDPAILEYISKREDLDIQSILNVLNKKSGVLGISGVSSDFRDLLDADLGGNERAKLARLAFAYRVMKYVGAYCAAMNGVDAVSFCAGVGENAKFIRGMIVKHLEFLGVELDEEANNICGQEAIISTANSKVKVCVIPTNEELVIARDTRAIVSQLKD